MCADGLICYTCDRPLFDRATLRLALKHRLNLLWATWFYPIAGVRAIAGDRDFGEGLPELCPRQRCKLTYYYDKKRYKTSLGFVSANPARKVRLDEIVD
ncbi:MAG: hypothetical protein WBA89_17665 [Microcoleus sp.]